MSSIQDLIGKIERSQKKPEKKLDPEKKVKKVKKIIPKPSPEDLKKAREKFSGKKENRENNGEQREEISGKKTGFSIKKGVNKKSNTPHKTEKSEKKSSKKPAKKTKSPIKKRFFVTQVCTSKKSCGEKFGPYVWERLCNDYDQDPACESFEVQGFQFERSPCQGACKKSANIRIKEKNAERHTQFSYLTPIKASKLIKIIKSGASPENIKRI